MHTNICNINWIQCVALAKKLFIYQIVILPYAENLKSSNVWILFAGTLLIIGKQTEVNYYDTELSNLRIITLSNAYWIFQNFQKNF